MAVCYHDIHATGSSDRVQASSHRCESSYRSLRTIDSRPSTYASLTDQMFLGKGCLSESRTSRFSHTRLYRYAVQGSDWAGSASCYSN